MPHCIKPNRVELEELVGRRLAGTADIVAAARELVDRGIGLVAVSRGSEGALFVAASRAISARLPVVSALSTVGAGDAMVAGLVAGLAEGGDLERLARLSVAFAAAKLGGVGPNLPSVSAVEALAARAEIAPV
jgi:1-phosphofructokinase